jgi:hypothetical protein
MAKRSVRKERRWPLVWWGKPFGTLREEFRLPSGDRDGTPVGVVILHALDCIVVQWKPEVTIWRSRL